MSGMEMHPGWAKRFDALPERKTPEPLAERTYVVGLPVVITVSDDGTVTYVVATEEASSAIADSFHEFGDDHEMTEEQMLRDCGLVDADHLLRNMPMCQTYSRAGQRATLTESETL